MVGKLRSISARIPWSLAGRAAAFGAAYCLLPGEWFVVAALILYLVPLFRPFELLLPFLVALFIVARAPHSLFSALLFAVAMFLLLGIRDLVLIDRGGAYRTLAHLLLFGSAFSFFGRVSAPAGPMSAAGAAFVGALLFALLRSIAARGDERVARPDGTVASAVGALLLGELAWTLMFLPLLPVSQAAVFFISAVALYELLADYLMGRLNRKKILTEASVLLAVVVFILAFNKWEM